MNSKLTINTGLRFEYEFGPTESANRQMMYFDPNQTLPTAGDVNNAYAGELRSLRGSGSGWAARSSFVVEYQGRPGLCGCERREHKSLGE